jgi:molybdopterin converting factor small subunit
MVKVQYIGPIRKFVEETVVDYNVDTPISIQELIDYLVKKYGDKFKQEIFTKAGDAFFYQILINGQNIYKLEGYQSKVNDGDMVLISVPLSGG